MKIRAGKNVVIMEQDRILATVSPVQPISASYFETGWQAIQETVSQSALSGQLRVRRVS